MSNLPTSSVGQPASASVPEQKTLCLVNTFVVHTAKALNEFAVACEVRLQDVHLKLSALETSLQLIEAQLGSTDLIANQDTAGLYGIESSHPNQVPAASQLVVGKSAAVDTAEAPQSWNAEGISPALAAATNVSQQVQTSAAFDANTSILAAAQTLKSSTAGTEPGSSPALAAVDNPLRNPDRRALMPDNGTSAPSGTAGIPTLVAASRPPLDSTTQPPTLLEELVQPSGCNQQDGISGDGTTDIATARQA